MLVEQHRYSPSVLNLAMIQHVVNGYDNKTNPAVATLPNTTLNRDCLQAMIDILQNEETSYLTAGRDQLARLANAKYGDRIVGLRDYLQRMQTDANLSVRHN